jgi:hypothetical protein
MTHLSDCEFRACQILLAFARMGANFDHLCKQMRREGIPEQSWRSLYEGCGIKVLLSGEERFVYAPDNLLPFAPRRVARCVWPERRSGGSAA